MDTPISEFPGEMEAEEVPSAVLVIDTDEVWRVALERLFARSGLECVTRPGVRDASLLLEQRAASFDAVLLELDDDDRSAFELLRHLRGAVPSLAAGVALVARSAPRDRDVLMAARLGVLDWVIKPAADRVLLARVEALCARTRMLRELRGELASARENAAVDPLTKLYNRRHFEQRLREATARARRHKQSFAVIMLDLDHFKKVNDEHGHEVGDQVLVAFADAVRETVRANDAGFRYGGEEFVVLLERCTVDGAVEIAERLRERVRERPVQLKNGSQLPVTFSAGVAASEEVEGFAGDELVNRADAALYRAKRAGRDRIERWGATPETSGDDPADGARASGDDMAILMLTLREARSLIAEPERWIPHGFAEDAHGHWRPVGSEEAIRFSVLGALVRVGGGSRHIAASSRRLFRESAPGPYAKMQSNDPDLTHEEVMTMLDRAIERLVRGH